MLAQTVRPGAWVIVDDGSSDDTFAVARELASRHDWISVAHTGRDDRALSDGRREGRPVLTLQRGVEALPRAFDTVTKLDADVTLPPDYFERLLAVFAADPGLGLASGHRRELEGGTWVRRHLTGTAVEAQCRTYRWACWHMVQPMEPRMGWDGVDECRAVVSGWRTLVVPGLDFDHRRVMGGRDGNRVRARIAEGRAAHFMGYRPSYLAVRAIWHVRRERAALGMLWGYAEAVLRHRPRCSDAAVIAYIRRGQRARHLARTLRQVRGLDVEPGPPPPP